MVNNDERSDCSVVSLCRIRPARKGSERKIKESKSLDGTPRRYKRHPPPNKSCGPREGFRRRPNLDRYLQSNPTRTKKREGRKKRRPFPPPHFTCLLLLLLATPPSKKGKKKRKKELGQERCAAQTTERRWPNSAQPYQRHARRSTLMAVGGVCFLFLLKWRGQSVKPIEHQTTRTANACLLVRERKKKKVFKKKKKQQHQVRSGSDRTSPYTYQFLFFILFYFIFFVVSLLWFSLSSSFCFSLLLLLPPLSFPTNRALSTYLSSNLPRCPLLLLLLLSTITKFSSSLSISCAQLSLLLSQMVLMDFQKLFSSAERIAQQWRTRLTTFQPTTHLRPVSEELRRDSEPHVV